MQLDSIDTTEFNKDIDLAKVNLLYQSLLQKEAPNLPQADHIRGHRIRNLSVWYDYLLRNDEDIDIGSLHLSPQLAWQSAVFATFQILMWKFNNLGLHPSYKEELERYFGPELRLWFINLAREATAIYRVFMIHPDSEITISPEPDLTCQACGNLNGQLFDLHCLSDIPSEDSEMIFTIIRRFPEFIVNKTDYVHPFLNRFGIQQGDNRTVLTVKGSLIKDPSRVKILQKETTYFMGG